MREEQCNQCEICHKTLTDSFHIDHDHKTKKVRSLLCGKCNTRLGAYEYLVSLPGFGDYLVDHLIPIPTLP